MPNVGLRARELAFHYPGANQPAIRDVSFSVARGEIFGFLGPSGAGKSTTQNILIHLLDGYSGPLIGGTASTVIGYPLAGLVPIELSALLTIALLAGLAAPLLALILAASAPNKVAGFAVVKVLNAVNLLPIAAFFVPPPLQYLAGALPAYWPMRALWPAAAGEPFTLFVMAGVVVNGAGVMVAAVMFERRLLKG